MIDAHRRSTLEQAQSKIDEVQNTLTEAHAAPEVSNRALKPLQDLKKRIEQDASIPSILMQKNLLLDEVDQAMDLIYATQTAKPGAAPAKPTKPVREIHPAQITTKGYLDNEADVERFLGDLRRELLAALSGQQRIRIR